MLCDLFLSQYGAIEISQSADQVGIAVSTTNGVHNLVHNWTKLLQFDGETYREPGE